MQKVVLAIINYKKKYLFHIRNKNPFRKKIALIGGKINLQETIDQAIVREIKEETGLITKKIKLIGVVEDNFNINNFQESKNYFFIYFVNSYGKINENKKEGQVVLLSDNEIKRNIKKFIPIDYFIFQYFKKNKSFFYFETLTSKANTKIKESKKYKCVLIGSFRKHINLVKNIRQFFQKNNIDVLSPKTCNILNPNEEFVLFDSDPPGLNEGEIQTIVLKKMHMSDFVFLINPDGYLGKSAAFEIGYAFANSIKVFALNKIKEMHQHFIYEIASPEQIIQKLKTLKEKPYIRN